MQICYFNHVSKFLLLSLLISISVTLSAFTPKDAPATLIKVHSSESDYRSGIVGIAQNYLGIPYILGARGPKSFDCSGFTSYIFQEFGVTMFPQARTQAEEGYEVDLQSARPSDLVFFGRKSNIAHVAIVLSNNAAGITVVHCTTSRGVVIENITQSHYWSPKIRFARNIVNRFFEFAPSSIFESMAAPLLSKVEDVQQQVENVLSSVAKSGVLNGASAALVSPQTQQVQATSSNYTTNYKSTIVEHHSYSRTYGHVSSDADDADADNDEGGQN